jgi:outer membrane receptor protein involved in Fe transport
MRFRLIAALLAVVALVAAAPVAAQEVTGAIQGAVRGQDGALLPGAAVTAVGPIGTVQAVTDARGEYRFPRLPSGVYKVTATLAGFATGESTIDLTVGSTARADFTLGVASVTETVSVVGESSQMDLTSSSTTTNISRERIEYIPRGRDFTDVVKQAAGASDESQAGGISIDGASGSENRFVIDGIDTTSPQTGVNSVPMRADFMEEVQVKSAGYAAEYGGSTGGVINAITKSGSNKWTGGVLMQYEERSWGGDQRPILVDSLTAPTFEYVNPQEDDEWRIDPGLFLGGPIVKDRLWFWGSYQPGIRQTERTVTFQNGTVNTFPQDFQVDYGAANLTGNLGAKLLFRAGASFSPYTQEKTLPAQSGRTTLTSPDQYLRGFEGERNIYSGSVDWIASSRFVVSARAGHYRTDGLSTEVPFPGLIHNFSTASTPAGIAAIPAEFRQPAGFVSDILVTDAQARDEYKRNYLGVDATWYVTGAGEHQIKFGYQGEKLYNDVQRGYNADRILYYAGRTYLDSTGRVRSGQYGYFRLLNISTLGSVTTRNDALFIQDTWKVSPKLTLNLGLRSEHERIPNYGNVGPQNPIDFAFGDKLAPRLGFTFDPKGDGRWKIFGSYGRYYDVMKYEMPRGSFGGDKWVDYFYTWDNPNYLANGAGCATGTNTISERPTCGAGTFIEPLDRRFNSADPSDPTVDPDLKPMMEDEFQVGLNHELGGGFVLGARYVYKDLKRAIEDVGIVVSGIGEVFYIANPGEGVSLELADPGVPNFPKAKREYQALELTAQKRFTNNWAAFISYTYGRLYGNYSGLASSDEDGRTSPNVNRFFDHIENTFDRNGQLVYGRLGTDRPHQLKGQFMYRFGWDMTVSLAQYIGTGIPISEEANVGAAIPFFPNGRDNLDRADTLLNTDLAIYQNFKLGNFDLQLGLNVLNLFDQDATTRRWNNRTVGSLPLTTEQFFAGGWDYEGLLRANPNLLDVKYNQTDQYQAPRQVRLSMRFQF